MHQGEQLVVFSPFQDFSKHLAKLFSESNVPALLLDGSTSPAKRGALIELFKSGEFPILIAGISSMGEGHSLECCANLVLPSLSWAYDENKQAIERVHRLTSKKDVSIYVMVTKNTIDERLVGLWQDKGDASDLALDGRLIEDDKEEIDIGQLLRDAVKDFDPNAATLDETEIKLSWNTTMIQALSDSYAAYREARSPDTTPQAAITHPSPPNLPIFGLTAHRNTPPPAKPTKSKPIIPDITPMPTPSNNHPASPKKSPISNPFNILPFPVTFTHPCATKKKTSPKKTAIPADTKNKARLPACFG